MLIKLIRDELLGFAKSRVMIVLWVLLPAIALAGFLLLHGAMVGKGAQQMTAAQFMAFIESSIAGTFAALMAAVDFVAEKNRNVYVLYAIRPIRREYLVYAKFAGVMVCVMVACVIAFFVGLVADAVRGSGVAGDPGDIAKAQVALILTIALATAGGIIFGVMARTVVVAVLLVLYVGQNLTYIPNIPVWFGVGRDYVWAFDTAGALVVVAVVWLAGWMFKRAQL